MKTLRTRFAKDIVSEFLPPKGKSDKVIIIASGMPSVPKLGEVLEFYSKKGFWIFHPRYRGSWESDGSFLEQSPEKDILDVINGISEGFFDLLSNKKYKVKFKKLYLFGCSFGGPAVILNSNNLKISKIVALSPVIDWNYLGKAEPIDKVLQYTKEAFGSAYRISDLNWNKLKSGSFYSPIQKVNEINGKNILIIQNKDDQSVSWRPVYEFCKKTGAQLELSKTGGHFNSSMFMDPNIYKRIKKFISK